MLTGVCIDPGYGLALQNGRWVPKDDERLHFLLANVGHDDVYLTPGKERIATIQFFKILAPAKKDSRIGGTEVAQKFFDPKTDQGGGLVFFRQMADVRQEVNELKQRIDEFGDRLSGIEAGSSQILLFGIYLLSATILGVSIAAILGIISNLKMELNSIGAYVLYVALGILGLIVIAIIYIATKFLQSKLFDNSKKSNRGVQ